VQEEALQRFIEDVFIHRGFSTADAHSVASALVWANLRGIDSHGAVRVAQYLKHLDDGDMNARPSIRTVSESMATVLLDADRAAGPVAMNAAADAAMARARAAGIGIAVVRATTHTAALGFYTSRVASAGFIAIALSGSVPQMAYHGARGRAVSTSPLSIAVPADDEPIVFDMAASVVGLGKLLQSGRTGQPISEGWATDEEGNPSTDPKTAVVPLPVGGAKGSGLSLMIELLTGVLAGNPLLAEALGQKNRRHRQNGLVIAIDIARFGNVDAFRREAVRLAAAIKGLPPSDPAVPVRIPGERGVQSQAKRSRDGIPLPPAVLRQLESISSSSGVDWPGQAT
jgi:ureidoglycolate dehydrogenase (NAD+)